VRGYHARLSASARSQRVAGGESDGASNGT
jgi:hypothetical protein